MPFVVTCPSHFATKGWSASSACNLLLPPYNIHTFYSPNNVLASNSVSEIKTIKRADISPLLIYPCHQALSLHWLRSRRASVLFGLIL